MTKIFIDGSAGTTGLRIHERLASRRELSLITLTEENRKDSAARKAAIEEADIAFLCLPDAAAVEAVELAAGCDTVIIDTATAHRTAEGWTYGMPELMKGAQKDKIAASKRIANPGCHASGFIALAAPLVEGGILKPDTALSCFSLTGYSGGGKKMIAEYEAEDRDILFEGPRQYGLSQKHKHLPEMQKVCGLDIAPVFCPIVADFYSGMEVTVPLFRKDLPEGTGIDDIRAFLRDYYADNGLIRYVDAVDDNGLISAAKYSGRDDMAVTVTGNEDRILLVSLFDNLGKGASGAAIQNMNIVLGRPASEGLEV